MTIGGTLAPATGMLKSGFGSMIKNSWIFWIFLIILVGIIAVVIIKQIWDKKRQWTHKLKVRRVQQNGFLEEAFYINMRRCPLIKGVEIFELESPLLGGWLMPSLSEYTGMNEFSIILDKNNRIFTNTGEKWCPDKNSVNVSGQHAEIDLSRGRLRDDFQKFNKVSDRIEWSKIAKYAFLGMLLIAATMILIVGLKEWSDSHEADAEEAQAMAQAMESLGKAMETSESTINAINLITLPKLKEMYGTNNMQEIINSQRATNETP